jgi:hypothetical protein
MPRELRAAYLLRWTGSGYRLEDGLIAQYPSSIERLEGRTGPVLPTGDAVGDGTLELKQELGHGHYEGRDCRCFLHHPTLCIAAYGFLISEARRVSVPGPRLRPAVPEICPSRRLSTQGRCPSDAGATS